MDQPNSPTVDVAMFAYNHEAYVAQALESVLGQKTDFPVRVVIGDDGSSDRTADIIRDVARRYPTRVTPLLDPVHRGLGSPDIVTLKVYQECRAPFVALLEGDDYWVDPLKLQKQVAFLRQHPECAACFTNSSIVRSDGTLVKRDRVPEDKKRQLSQRDIVAGWVPPTNTFMFRGLPDGLPGSFYRVVNGDFFLACVVTETGDIGYIDDITAHYRLHETSLWSTKPRRFIYENNLNTREVLLGFFGGRHRDLLLSSVNESYAALLDLHIEERHPIRFLSTLLSFASRDITLGDRAYLKYLRALLRRGARAAFRPTR